MMSEKLMYSVKATIERYKKASSDSSNNGSISEVNTQVSLKIQSFFTLLFNLISFMSIMISPFHIFQ